MNISDIKVGDRVQVRGVSALVSNPGRQWWQFWKPVLVPSSKPQEFVCVANEPSRAMSGAALAADLQEQA